MRAKLHSLVAAEGPFVATIRARFPNAIAIYEEPLALWDTAGSLAEVAGCPVDLLDLRAASTVM